MRVSRETLEPAEAKLLKVIAAVQSLIERG